MSDSYFKVKSKKMLKDLTIGERLETSDFSALCPTGEFVQLEYVEQDSNVEPYPVFPGIFSIQKTAAGLKLETTSFSEQNIFAGYSPTSKITSKIDQFFSKVAVYEKYGIRPAKRGMLLYGSPGCGKSIAIKTICETYNNNGDTAIVLWHTDKVDPVEVKEFIKRFEYNGVNKLILVAEDIGGVEIDQVKIKSQSSLLALLDNVEKTFSITTLVLATTNFPEIFLENLTKRPGRFDDLISFDKPTGQQRLDLFKFYHGTISENDEFTKEFKSKRFDEFSVAHVREIMLRSALYDLTLLEAAEQILSDINKFKNMFQDKKKLGISAYDSSDDY